jgi:hypothetical protein
MRDQPCEKFIKVTVLDPKTAPLNNIEKKLKKNLLKLHPTEYFSKMSDPKFGLPERAALQALKPRFNNIRALLEDTLRDIRNGSRTSGANYFARVQRTLKAKLRWAVSDHLVYRLALWANRQVKSAKRVLRALGLTAPDIRMALPSGKQDRRLRARALYVVDREYTTGMAFRPFLSETARRITGIGTPASTSFPLGMSSSVPLSGGPEGFRLSPSSRVAILGGFPHPLWKTRGIGLK